jgi:hypothetical protein
MAVLAQKSVIPVFRYDLSSEKISKAAKISLPRPCMIISVGLLLLGMGLVFLMLLGTIPIGFLTALAGFFLTAVGGTLALIFFGEI